MDAPEAPLIEETLGASATAAALDDGAVTRWWQTTAFLEVAGPDAPRLLDGLCTQAVERIGPGAGATGLFLDAKARIVAPAVVHRVEDAQWQDPRRDAPVDAAPRLLLETLPELVDALGTHLARYRLRARASIAPVDVATVGVIGERAQELAPAARGAAGCWVAVSGHARPTLAFVGTADACRTVVRELLPAAGVGLARPEVVEADRIQRGVPGLHDLLPGRMPAEVGGMQSAVALDAGCYLGQEPVARLHYRGRANRTLRRLESDARIMPAAAGSHDPEHPLELRRAGDAADARPVGRLTTWARGADGRDVALGVLRREVEAGEPLVLAGSDQLLRACDAPPR